MNVIRLLRRPGKEGSLQAAELLSAVLEAAEDAVLVAEEGGGLIYANRVAVRLLGYSWAELEGKPLGEIAADLEGKRWTELWKLWKRPEPHVLETFCRRKDGSGVLAEATCAHLVVGGHSYHSVFLREAGRRPHLEEQLRQSQKMEAVGRLAAGVAHDFNNLLTAVMLYSGLLLNQLSPNSRLRQHADEIRMASERAAALVGQLLMFSRQAATEPRPVNLNEGISGILELLRQMLGENVELVTQLEPGLAAVKADAMQMEQVLLNLALNARDAMGGKGRLVISTGNLHREAEAVPESLPAGDYVSLAVTDTGCGMDGETRSRIFEPFFTTKPPGEGTGLGLWTVYTIVRQAGGGIEVTSEPGQGTSIRLLLPRSEAVELPAPAPAPEWKQVTILLVEDEDAVRRSLQETLEQYGYQVLATRNGPEALKLSQKYQAEVDLLITDLVLPGPCGREVAEALRKQRPGLRVLYISGYADAERTGPIEARFFCRKPFTDATLRSKIRELLGAEAAATG
ncbi:MAG: ATP-binding protein [Acidobacteriota bacterium]|nr:ATP-binding protein [Acidobacteriota bacterium]